MLKVVHLYFHQLHQQEVVLEDKVEVEDPLMLLELVDQEEVEVVNLLFVEHLVIHHQQHHHKVIQEEIV